jgi:hypothetical protein
LFDIGSDNGPKDVILDVAPLLPHPSMISDMDTAAKDLGVGLLAEPEVFYRTVL